MTIHIWEELYAILHSLAGGARYGFRVRSSHALVMALLFKRDLPARAKLHSILKVALEHSLNLAAFATVYKSILALLKWTHRHLMIQHRLLGGEGNNRHWDEGIFRWLGRVLLTALGR